MNIVSSDTKYSIPLGGYDTWQTLCSTIRFHLVSSADQIPHALDFLETGCCKNQDCLKAAREFNLVRDCLSQFKPNQIVYDDKNPDRCPPWGDKISPIITSCANYLTTGDGNDLLAEIVKILAYAYYAKADVETK
ncbi:MAG: hypothetical protein IJH64_01340 [Oscillospiraceae bacterium]|nr:hypothetical protein [Oscillospiraceae bacterium]